MDQLQFKESDYVDVDEAKFKQTILLDPQESQLGTFVKAEAAPLPLLPKTKAGGILY